MDSQALSFRPIAIVRSPFDKPSDTPIQAAGALGATGWIEVHPEFEEGLRDIEGFSHLIVVHHFHRVGPARLTVTPFLDTASHGIFATRAPARPNAIGLSVVRLLAVLGTRLEVADLDMLDGTPVLDLKPFVPAFDHREAVRIGWFGGKLGALEGKRADGRFLGDAEPAP
jgi:tRNA-Thr(GGU) m(6)t(6)A37 methyltransferase TsaA